MFEREHQELKEPISNLIDYVWRAHESGSPHVEDHGLIELVTNKYGQEKGDEVASRFPIALDKLGENNGSLRSEGPFFQLETSQFTIQFTSPLAGSYEISADKLSLTFAEGNSVIVEKDFFGIPFSVAVQRIDFEKTGLFVDVGNNAYNLRVTWP